MNSSVSSILDILSDAEAARIENRRKTFEILSLEPMLTIEDILIDKRPLVSEPLRSLFDDLSKIVEKHSVEEDIAEWPFKYFWSDPSEPRHSKLLHYFINPDGKHGCGPFLLRKLVEIFVAALPANHSFPSISERHDQFWRACRVDAETRRGDDQCGQMDLFITRDIDRERFAIVIENKVKQAPNQLNQLQNYVKKAKHRPASFVENEIFVFFLPLIDDCWPHKSDVEAIQKQGVAYAYVTFEQHIKPWLKAVLDTNWPDGLPRRIRKHLSYYRNFIDYLINQRKKTAMSDKILERLKQAADDAKVGKDKLPSWDEVLRLETAFHEFKPYFERMLRGGFLLRVEEILTTRATTTWHVEGRNTTAKSVTSEFDECFAQGNR